MSLPSSGFIYVCNFEIIMNLATTVELQWLEHLLNHQIMSETGVVRANEC